MKKLLHLKKEQQELMPLFNGAFIENKPIPFPNRNGSSAYSNLFYWAHLEALETSEFPLHPHEGFEIMTFVFKGSIEHYDTATKVWTPLGLGGVQVIQAGSGVQHAEKITKGTQLFQIWFDPDFSKSMIKDACYRDYQVNEFTSEKENAVERLIYLKDRGVISYDTPNISIEKLKFVSGKYQETLEENYTYSYYLLGGEVTVDNELMTKDDFLVLNSSKEVSITAKSTSELFVIKSLTNIEYPRFIDKY
ncbi:MAG: redox-sensitive bicupin YhaK (pirin superfamily) [Sulfurimonas sp.]|jgi:redox-sensitive bicupin YhaK (pirin superfamily)|uniref:pirin family protein n=1 Tax=Sulfurimonas sp. TaxID=2022749 RepID=UPI0039E22794